VKSLPFVTITPGCGGIFKSNALDFQVEEIPAYEPGGEGEHLFLWIEKTGRSTPDIGKQLSRKLGIGDQEVSWAGLKDAQAITRQYFCLPARKARADMTQFELEGAKILSAKKHQNKLKSGHLKGNRFSVIVREVTDVNAALATIEQLKKTGMPNYFGEQRFGIDNLNAQRGKVILQKGGQYSNRFQRKMFLSAFQSDLFNRVLAKRIQMNVFNVALTGDVLKKHDSHGEFVCTDDSIDSPRVHSFEVSPTGPMFGPEMRAVTGVPFEIEELVLADEKISRDLFVAGGDETKGTRRFSRVIPENLQAAADGNVLKLEFNLLSGSYATVLLRELIKANVDESLVD
jgi:tRNA pseudouridine13 synthase